MNMFLWPVIGKMHTLSAPVNWVPVGRVELAAALRLARGPSSFFKITRASAPYMLRMGGSWQYHKNQTTGINRLRRISVMLSMRVNGQKSGFTNPWDCSLEFCVWSRWVLRSHVPPQRDWNFLLYSNRPFEEDRGNSLAEVFSRHDHHRQDIQFLPSSWPLGDVVVLLSLTSSKTVASLARSRSKASFEGHGLTIGLWT
jgi:hypothetical protein